MPAYRKLQHQALSNSRRCLLVAGLLALCFVTVTGFSSCTSNRRLPYPTEPAQRLSPVSEALKVDLFFDATLSMEGFVKTQSSSYYQQTVPLLERGVIEGWKGGQVAFHKFGDEIAPLPGRQYLDAAKATFYSDAKYNRKTYIERVIDRAELDHLTVIVTDLFQDNADVNQLSEKLKQKFIANGLAIGVLGIRSQYKGAVYDVGADNYTFAYTAEEKPETGRPFYLLAFGSHANIARYFDTLQSSGINAFPEKHVLILSHFLTAQPASFTSAKLKTADRISEISLSNLLTPGYAGDQVKAFKITKGKAEAHFSTEWPYQPLPNALEYSSNLQSDVESWKGEDTGAKELVLSENQQAIRALNVVATLIPENPPFNQLQIHADLKVGEIPVAGTYRYRVRLRPGRYGLPSWVSEWNMRDPEIKAWHLHPSDFNGAKTYNLENFLGTLQGAVLGTNPPQVGDIYLYIRIDK